MNIEIKPFIHQVRFTPQIVRQPLKERFRFVASGRLAWLSDWRRKTKPRTDETAGFYLSMNTPLTPEQLEALRRLDACTLANAIETFHERLRNEGFADNSVHCLFPHLKPMLGYAATIKVRGSAPPDSR